MRRQRKRHELRMPLHFPEMYSVGTKCCHHDNGITTRVRWRIDYGNHHLWRYYEDDVILIHYWRRIRIPWILWATFR